MAFSTLSAQQETNRKILEDLQLKKQLLQKGTIPGLSAPLGQMHQTLGSTSEFIQNTGTTVTVPRSVFNPTSSTTLGFFIPQDSHYGNTFIPVLPRLDVLPLNHVAKLKKLEEFLHGVEGFNKPKIQLEQYMTPPHIASCILYDIQIKYDDIEGKLVGDLGCGCGMLTIGSFLLGAQLTIGFEIDNDAIGILRQNVTEMELPAIDCIRADVLQLRHYNKWDNLFDTVVMNPPFGTKNNVGMDISFLETGISLSSGAVYSLHKTSTREYLKKKCREWAVRGEVIAELKYNLDATYKFHKNKCVDIEVDIWRFDVSERNV